MKTLLFIAVLFCVGYIAIHHRPSKQRAIHKTQQSGMPEQSKKYRGRDTDELRAELSAKEQLLATVKTMIENKAVSTPQCSHPTNITFSSDTLHDMAELEADVRALRTELRSR